MLSESAVKDISFDITKWSIFIYSNNMWRLSFISNLFLGSVIIGFVYGNLLFNIKYANEEKMSKDDNNDIKFSNNGWYVDIISKTFFKKTNSRSLNSLLKLLISFDKSLTSVFVIVIVFLFDILLLLLTIQKHILH